MDQLSDMNSHMDSIIQVISNLIKNYLIYFICLFSFVGRRFDLNGKEKNWWTSKTQTEFNHRAQCFVTQYGKVVDPIAQIHVSILESIIY